MNNEIERFAKDVSSNSAFREELKAIGTDNDAVVSFANSRGYQFSVSDVDALSGGGNEELSDSQLDSVVGGAKVLLYGDGSGYVYATSHKCFIWY